MKRKIFRFILGLLSLGLVLGCIFLAYSGIYMVRLEAAEVVLNIAGAGFMLFFVVLILRYLSLIFLATLEYLRQRNDPSEPTEFSPISVIVPAYNEGPVVEASLRSVMQLNYPNYEVICVDDGSSDDTFEKASRLAELDGTKKLRVFSQVNGGKASALNHGISRARGEFVFCMDSDSRIEPDTLRNMIVHFRDPKVGAVAGNVKVVNRRHVLTKLQALEYIEGLNLIRAAQAFTGKISVIPGPVGMFRKTVLDEVKGYSSDTYAEDCELTLRIYMAGYEIRYEPKAIAFTEAPEAFDALFRQRYRWGRGILQAILTHRGILVQPWKGLGNWFALWTQLTEAVFLPTANVLVMILIIASMMSGGLSYLLLAWWAQLTILDLMVALFCVSIEHEELSLVPYAILYRLYYVPYVDVMRFFAWVDEMMGVRMGWMSLERLGRI
jgi:poly-beta-1,6 N-acetyl-D-glucosamine synthase